MTRLAVIFLMICSPALYAQSGCKPKMNWVGGKLQSVDCGGKMRVHDIMPGAKNLSSRPSTHAGQPQETKGSVGQGNQDATEIPKPIEDSYEAYLQGFYNYHLHALQNRRAVFDFQYSSTRAIFGLVLLLVVSGLGFAALQFKKGIQGTDQLEISAGSIKVSSSTMGIIILVISMGFFFLYLKYVYPVQIVTDPAQISVTEKPLDMK